MKHILLRNKQSAPGIQAFLLNYYTEVPFTSPNNFVRMQITADIAMYSSLSAP